MNNNIIPIFTSDASLGRSILTADDYEKIDKDGKKVNKEPDNESVSIWTIANQHKINPVYIVENSMVSFISHSKYAKKLGKKMVFGVKYKILTDASDRSEESFLSESDVIVFMRSQDSYADFIKLFSAMNADSNHFYYYNRGDWKTLQKYWSDKLLLAIPFYNSFLEKNTFNYGHRAIPSFGDMNPYFFVESHDLPFDSILSNIVKNYCDIHKYPMINTHSVYYYKDEDAVSYQNLRCIIKRTSFDMPELKHFCSDQFSFESYAAK